MIKQFPLPSHQQARPASIAAMAAARQNKFWEYHDEIFKDFQNLSENKLVEIAKKLGLDMDKFNKDRKDPAIQTFIEKDVNDGRAAGVRGTPTIFVNGRRAQERSVEGFARMVDEELKKTRK